MDPRSYRHNMIGNCDAEALTKFLGQAAVTVEEGDWPLSRNKQMEYQLLSRQRCIRIYGILASLYQIRSLTKTEHRSNIRTLSLRPHSYPGPSGSSYIFACSGFATAATPLHLAYT